MDTGSFFVTSLNDEFSDSEFDDEFAEENDVELAEAEADDAEEESDGDDGEEIAESHSPVAAAEDDDFAEFLKQSKLELERAKRVETAQPKSAAATTAQKSAAKSATAKAPQKEKKKQEVASKPVNPLAVTIPIGMKKRKMTELLKKPVHPSWRVRLEHACREQSVISSAISARKNGAVRSIPISTASDSDSNSSTDASAAESS